MKKRFGMLCLAMMLAAVATATGCGPKAQETPATSDVAVATATGKMIDAATAATLNVRALFQGDAPAPKALPIQGNPECSALHPGGKAFSEELLVKDGGLQNVFVYVKSGLEGVSFPPPADKLTIDNKGCVYVPHVAGARVGQEIVFLNSDATLHNIHSFSKNSKGFNVGLPFQGMKQTKKFTASEVMVSLKCDVHPWMQGFLGVLDHPYFAVTDENGNTSIPNLPPGNYVLEAWHEKLGARSQTVEIGPRESKDVEFNFSS